MSISKLLPGVKKNVLLKNHTTFRIGGRAKYFFEAKTKDDLIGAVKLAKKLRLPFFILGGGSNLLVSDKGFEGLVINFQFSPALLQKGGVQKNKIVVGAGTRLAKLVNVGLDWAVGIPGTVGGAVCGNAGAFGKSMQDAIESVEVFDVKTGKIKVFKNKNCQFGYRESIFKNKKDQSTKQSFVLGRAQKHINLCARCSDLVILSVEIKPGKSNPKKIKEYLDYRRQHHPQLPSAGSVFKNFQFSPALLQKDGVQLLIKKFPEFAQFKERGEIPAAFLISECGLSGKKIGDAQISEKHPNFIVNLGNGKAKDVIKLINLTKKTVKKKFKIKLEEEIVILSEAKKI